MSDWQSVIAASSKSATWVALEQYIKQQIEMHTAMCVSFGSTNEQVRSSQASIAELRRILELPERLRSRNL